MRVYVPLTLPRLAEARTTGEVGNGPLDAYAVTPGLREWYASDDVEELEYAALTRAAQSSLRLLASEPGAAHRRVVLAVDVPDARAVADPDRSLEAGAIGAVRVTGPVPMSTAAAIHVDGPDAEADVATAVERVGAADLGDDDARLVVDGVEDHELLWYGVQELPQLVEGN